MASFAFLLLSILINICVSQPELYALIGDGESCEGKSGDLSDYGLSSNEQISYDLTKLYNSDGHTVPDQALGPNKLLRMSICGAMTPESTACGQEGEKWCFEEIGTDRTCIAGIANWEQNTATASLIEYYAMFDTPQIEKDSALGIRVSVLDYKQFNITCPNRHAVVNYDIICDSSTNWTHLGFTQNLTDCNWNVTLRSQYGCFDFIPLSSSSGSNTNLSAGSVFIILFIVFMLTYCILGCAYNSFYHGRVGFDAVPNKDSWAQFTRYTRAGCETTRDAACCNASTGPYQEL